MLESRAGEITEGLVLQVEPMDQTVVAAWSWHCRVWFLEAREGILNALPHLKCQAVLKECLG